MKSISRTPVGVAPRRAIFGPWTGKFNRDCRTSNVSEFLSPEVTNTLVAEPRDCCPSDRMNWPFWYAADIETKPFSAKVKAGAAGFAAGGAATGAGAGAAAGGAAGAAGAGAGGA